MKQNRLFILTATLNTLALAAVLMAWLQAIGSQINLLEIASLLALSAFSLMWVHYVSDAIGNRWLPGQTVGWQYKLSRIAVLIAILLHPLLVNIYLIQNDYGWPPGSFGEYFGSRYVFIYFGIAALCIFLAFEFKSWWKQRGWWRYVWHLTHLAMFLVLIHGFKLGIVTNSDWYYVVWWLYTITYSLVLLNIYLRYYKSMNGRKIIAIIVILLLVGGAVMAGLSMRPDKPETSQQTQSPIGTDSKEQTNAQANETTKTITLSELGQNNGKNGALCWIAVNGTVYEIRNNPNWQNGEHIPSNGQASCGRDLSEVIGLSPHGKSVLSGLDEIGTLEN